MKRPLLCSALFILALPALATDGVIEINHARALAGGVTPGDAPGYPVTISQAGSYRLTGNLTLPDANTIGIYSTADNVGLDLNGFAVIGPNYCTYSSGVTCTEAGGADGIFLIGDNAGVRNGVVRGVTGDGIEVGGVAVVDSVRVSHAGQVGIKLSGTGGVVRDSVVSLARTIGIQTQQGGLVHGSALVGIGDTGIVLAGPDSLATDNVAAAHTNAISCTGGSSGFGNNVLRAAVMTINANCATADMGNNKSY